MLTPASLYILRSCANLSIDTLVRQSRMVLARSSAAACCSGVSAPRPRPPPPPPRAAGGASPRGAALHGWPFHDELNWGGGASGFGAAPRRPAPPPGPPPRPLFGEPAKFSAGPSINSM